MKKVLAIILAVLMLSGCQLASEEKREDRFQDKLVGVFVTFDYLDLEFDIEGYLGDNAGALKDGGEIVLDPGEGMEYGGRLWAEIGEIGWEFPGHEGISMGQMWREDHWAGFSTPGFCGMKTIVEQTEMRDSIAEEGTIYVPADTRDFIFYCNPVYMSADGTYYAVQGDSFHSASGVYGMSQSVKSEIKETLDGAETVYSAEYTVRIEGVELADRVVVIQMSADHAELSRAEYVPVEMPESIQADPEAAYLIVEEYAGGEATRTLYQPGDESIKVFYQNTQVYCLPQFTQIDWAE